MVSLVNILKTTELYIFKSSINMIFELYLNKNYDHPHFVIMGNFSWNRNTIKQGDDT